MENQKFCGNFARRPILNQKSARHNQTNLQKLKATGSKASLLCYDPVLLGLKIQNGGQDEGVTSHDRSF